MIASTIIIEYLTSKFEGIGKFSANEREFMIPSIFRPTDRRLKLSINTDTGLWQDFLSGEVGNFVKLYALLENKSYTASESELLIRSLFKNDESRIPLIKEKVEETKPLSDTLDKITALSYDSEDPLIQQAWCFLFQRKLIDLEEDRFAYYLERSGEYKNRLIIPFIKNEVMYYFQARSLNTEDFPKYLNPPSDSGVRPSHILYPFDEEADSLVVCEGPLDAISLQLQGINATCTMGCHVSREQMDILKDFEGDIIVGYDNDAAGNRGLERFDSLRKCKMMGELNVCFPPKQHNDWNEAHVKDFNLKKWVQKESFVYDYEYRILNAL
jgi:5S rRNA maturation endonuclease (ribonuclease M5)/CRISPR/Cas system-associated protein Cas5 (RAMP superfamily)